jgi:hypothetical protein
VTLLSKTFKALIESINAQIKILNDNNLKIYDIENPEYFVKEICYDQECDQIFFKTEEEQNE